MQKLKLVVLTLGLTLLVGCGTTAGVTSQPVLKSKTIQADEVCAPFGDGWIQLNGWAMNPLGVSGGVHSIFSGYAAQKPDSSGECELLKGPDGKSVKIFLSASQASDIRRDAITGGIGIARSFVQGGLAAEIRSNSGCNGGSCGSSNPINVFAQASNVATAHTESAIDIDHSSGPMCMTGGCGGGMPVD